SLDAAGAVEGLPTLPGRAPAPASGLPAPRDEPSSAAPSSAAPSSAAPAPLALHAEGQLARRAGAIEGDARLRLEGLWPHSLHLRLERLHAGARRVAVRHLRAQARGLRLTASGAYRPASNRLDADARLDHLDLARVGRLVDLPLAGSLEADARFDGPLSPDAGARASLTARGEQLRVAGVRVPSAGVALHQDGPVARLRAVATLPAGSVGLDAQGKALVGASVVAAPTRTYWRADVHAHRLDHAALAELLPGAPPLEGQSEVALQLAGELPLPAARLRWRARRARVVLPDTPVDPVDLALRAELDHDRLAATLESADRHGDLATLRARLPEALLRALAEAPAAGPTDAAGRPGAESPSAASPLTPHALLARLREHPWELELLVAPRRLDRLPAPLDPGLPPSAPDATLGGELRVGRRPGEPLTLRAVARGDLAPMLASDARCAPGGDTHARVVAHLRDPGGPTLDRLDAEAKLAITAGPGEPALAGGVARAALPLGAWLAGRPARPSGAHATLHTEGVDLGRLPFVCREARGTLRGELALRDAFTDAPSARLDLAVDELDVGAGAPYALSLEGSAEDGRLAGELLLREPGPPGGAGRPRVTLTARAPLRWTEPLPTLADGPLEADARLDDAPLAALLFAVPGVDRPGGTLAGELHAEGRSLEDAALRGELSLTEVQLALASGQRFEDLHGRLLFAPDAWRIRELHTEDLDGHATVDGRVSVDGLLPTGADLQVDLDEYPLRLEGLVYARLDGRAALDADLDATPARADLRLEDLDVALPGSLPDQLMALEDHPRVLYEGEPGYAADSVEAALEAARGAAAEPGDDTTPSPYLPLVLELRSAEPFWVRRSDFAVQAELDLEARIEAGGVALVGPVDIRRGNVTLLGRGFDLEPGTLRFDGGRRVDPLVDVAAVHRLNGGDTVTIDIEGRALAPELSFRTSVPGVATDRGVLELLVRGRRGASEADAQSQALSFLTGLTGGLLTDLTQRRAGEYVPVLSIESQAGGETRLRAGFAADELIPEGWEDVIQGAYVEGFVGAQSGEGAGTRATGGVLLELLFPRDLVGTATFQEGSQWSVDLQWEP
ncbi:MAG TPA: translocation/assembly module TamB domain-containing protein, partial [Polyangiaceae bacterium LLY-WYZ-15_(1-7)]|nr:translocation/assembly module TamB domain-containing protein [Polyangiaceae bacterium LLY-WYZ-15_(1-7)]